MREMQKFKQAIYESLTEEYEARIPQITEKHIFSEKFERKMRKLIKRRKKPYYKLINTAWKRAACVLAAVIASTAIALQVEAVRDAFKDFLAYIYEKFSILQAADNTDIPETIEDTYAITYDLSGYSADFEESDFFSTHIIYVNETFVIEFYQMTKSAYNMIWNTEEADIEEVIINGCEAVFFCDNHNYNNLIWDNGNYIISVSSNLDKETLVNIANSVQKVE